MKGKKLDDDVIREALGVLLKHADAVDAPVGRYESVAMGSGRPFAVFVFLGRPNLAHVIDQVIEQAAVAVRTGQSITVSVDLEPDGSP